VFDDGVIQQLATPEDLYERPENAFVAQFIGENNKLMARVEKIEGDTAHVVFDTGAKATAKAVNCAGAGEMTTLSIRPERVTVGATKSANMAEAKVLELIYLGDHIRCRISVHGNDDFVVKVPNAHGHKHLVVGETTQVGWEAEDCRALDA